MQWCGGTSYRIYSHIFPQQTSPFVIHRRLKMVNNVYVSMSACVVRKLILLCIEFLYEILLRVPKLCQNGSHYQLGVS